MATEAAGIEALGAGLAIGLTALGTAWAQKEIGAATVGAMAEDEALFGRGLVLTVIPETMVIFGLVVALVALGFI